MKKVSDSFIFKDREKMQETLEKSYDEALKDEIFYEMVSKLAYSKKELIKYTSMLEECAIEYGNCKGCKGLLECKNKLIGYAYLPTVREKQLLFEYETCKYRKEMNEAVKHQKNMELFEVPQELKKACMKDIDTKDKNRYPVIKWIQNFIRNYEKDPHQKGLYLYGSFGAGKSYLIAAMFSELARHNIKSAIVFWPEFLRDLKSSFGTTFDEKYNAIKRVPLLLIDDIGAEVTTEWGRDEIFCPLIQYRMDENLPTFFTSNLDLKLLEEHFSCSKKGIDVVKSGRIISRIVQLTDQIEMISENRRK